MLREGGKKRGGMKVVVKQLDKSLDRTLGAGLRIESERESDTKVDGTDMVQLAASDTRSHWNRISGRDRRSGAWGSRYCTTTTDSILVVAAAAVGV